MRHTRIFCSTFVAALLVCAVASVTASAKLPEWGQCRALEGGGGKYANDGCTQQVKKVYGAYTGAYEWYPLGRSANEMSDGQQAQLQSSSGEETSETFRFASGREIRCHAEGTAGGSRLPLDGSNDMTDALDLASNGCEEPVLGLENNGEPGLGGLPPGNCHSFGAGEGSEIETGPEFEDGETVPASGTTWRGKTLFLSAKTSSTPAAGISYKTEPAAQRFFPQITCESGPDSEPLSVQIGGHRRSERLVEEISPVNKMLSSGFTATLQPQSKGGTEALVNTGAYEPVTIESSIRFGREIYLPYEQRVAWEEQYGGKNYEPYDNELELKATP